MNVNSSSNSSYDPFPGMNFFQIQAENPPNEEQPLFQTRNYRTFGHITEAIPYCIKTFQNRLAPLEFNNFKEFKKILSVEMGGNKVSWGELIRGLLSRGIIDFKRADEGMEIFLRFYRIWNIGANGSPEINPIALSELNIDECPFTSGLLYFDKKNSNRFLWASLKFPADFVQKMADEFLGGNPIENNYGPLLIKELFNRDLINPKNTPDLLKALLKIVPDLEAFEELLKTAKIQ